MQEQLISFETAKLAKEKGFTEFCFHKFNKDINGDYEESSIMANIHDHVIETYNRPTQSFLQKWLMEKHRLIVLVSYNYDYDLTPYAYWIYKENESDPINQRVNDLHTYEDALELGLQETLKLIKNDSPRN